MRAAALLPSAVHLEQEVWNEAPACSVLSVHEHRAVVVAATIRACDVAFGQAQRTGLFMVDFASPKHAPLAIAQAASNEAEGSAGLAGLHPLHQHAPHCCHKGQEDAQHE